MREEVLERRRRRRLVVVLSQTVLRRPRLREKAAPHLLQPRDGQAKQSLRRRMLRPNERRHLLDLSLVFLLRWPTLANSHVRILQGLFQ
jgi:hypothetical protein